MKYYNWSLSKNEIIKSERGISFEEIVYRIKSGNILSIENNKNYKNQNIYILEIDNYAFVVPFIETENEIYLKTAFPSRKYTKIYKLKGDNNANK